MGVNTGDLKKRGLVEISTRGCFYRYDYYVEGISRKFAHIFDIYS
jgi:hypothetical protein